MKTTWIPTIVAAVLFMMVVAIFAYCRQQIIASAAEPVLVGPPEEEPLNTLDPTDPYKDNMQVLTLEDATYCPRIYMRITRGETFWVDKKGRVFEICRKTGRLVQSL